MPTSSNHDSGDSLEDRLMDDLRLADNEELFSILSLGDARQSHLKLQKVVFILSKIHNNKSAAVAYKFGPFDEYLMEKIQSSDLPFISNESGKYQLTPYGKLAYPKVKQRIGETRPDLVDFADVLRSMSERDIKAVSYYLFPEFTQESEIREEVKHDIEKLLNSGKKFRISRQEDLAGSAIATS
ncbi:MAG: hypothetical protein JRN15_15225 [Nitrososphaerota archaeon]|nr:hypothetical protein [Nitrososphaerota archaeon]